MPVSPVAEPWCPVCRQKVATRPTREAGLRGVFVEHGGCEGEGRKALDRDWGFVVPSWEFFGPTPGGAESAPASGPWTDCPAHPPTEDKGPHGWVACQERERRFRAMTVACADPLDRYRDVADLAREVLNAAGGHTASGHCAACAGAELVTDSGRVDGCTQPEVCGTANDPGQLCPSCDAAFEAWREVNPNPLPNPNFYSWSDSL